MRGGARLYASGIVETVTSDEAAPPDGGDGEDDDVTVAVESPARGRLPYVGALDGLRAVCLLAVLCYHGTFSWAPGGFLGVSTFFTLSGFLITALMIVEVRDTGTVALGRFWSARARRLLPAAGLTLLLVVAFARLGASSTQLSGLRQDLWASFGLSINWRLALSGRAYGGYASAASPVQHLWSLAVEEQFYLLLPPLVLGAIHLGRRSGRPPRVVLAWGAAGLAALSAAAMLSAVRPDGDVTWAYYATHTRAAELLVGVVLACVAHHLVGWKHRRAVLPVAGVAAVVVLAAYWAVADQPDRWLYRGGIAAYSLASALVIVACLYPTPVSRVLDTRPLREVGKISYGAYLYHWPLFSWLDADTVGLDGYPLFAVQVAVTLALAWLSARFVEMPIRKGRLLGGMRPPVLAVSVAAALVLTLLVPWRTSDTGPSGVEVATGQRVEAVEAPVAVSTAPADTDPATPEVRRLLLVGDSIPQQLAPYLAGALPGVDVRWIGHPGIGPLTDQGAIAGDLEDAIAEIDPDMVLFHFAGSYLERQDGAQPFVTDDGEEVPDDSEAMVAAWEEQSRRLVGIARSRGATVLWGLIPTIDGDNWFGFLSDTVNGLNAAYRRLPEVTILDWNTLTEAPDGGFTPTLVDAEGTAEQGRADDGLHFTAFGNAVLAATVVEQVAAWPGRTPPQP